jgi:hypothetical protein
MLSSISLLFSIVMIVLEIVVGVMLILGHKSKLTSWIFLLLILFFTVLTGFTFLTGYVPSDVNFFAFSKWGPYSVTNMRVTDCGCFGDFIKLVPRFFSDLGLLIPYSIFSVIKDMHQLFSLNARRIIVGATAVLVLLFCIRNSMWDLPVIDFRPFAVGTNLYEKKKAEEDAMAAVPVTLKLKNKTTGEEKLIPQPEYLKMETVSKRRMSNVDQIKASLC